DLARHKTGILRRNVDVLVADSPECCFWLQACAATRGARCVAAVFRQQYAHMHTVRTAFQPFEEPAHAVPLRIPCPFKAAPVGVTVNDPFLFLGSQLIPGRVKAYPGLSGVA